MNSLSSWNISTKEKLLLLAFTPEPFQLNVSISAKVYLITLSVIILPFMLRSSPSQAAFLCKGLHYTLHKLMGTHLFPVPWLGQGEGFLFSILDVMRHLFSQSVIVRKYFIMKFWESIRPDTRSKKSYNILHGTLSSVQKCMVRAHRPSTLCCSMDLPQMGLQSLQTGTQRNLPPFFLHWLHN